MLDYKREYERWLASDALNADEKAELQAIAGDEKEIESRFYGPLEFGTAGLRGTMKVGLHQMNVHVIRWATQGFADVIAAEGDEAKQKGVAICMDCRVNSMAFARAAAEVCAANGIRVRIFESLRPTPELSFAVRYYGCQAGINVTASHNPKEYNGYKVYWADGAQLPPQHAAAIARELETIDIFTGVTSMDFDEAVQKGLITMLGADCDERFMANVMSMVNDYDTVKKSRATLSSSTRPSTAAATSSYPRRLQSLASSTFSACPSRWSSTATSPRSSPRTRRIPRASISPLTLPRRTTSTLSSAPTPTATASASWCATSRASSSLSPATRRACCCSTI